ncbi:MAG: class I SAM-dependent methyltransferase [Bacteroidetes bacterium]|nr:class I SAM-dependent methyltransferase [Bacteroidota bacterium]
MDLNDPLSSSGWVPLRLPVPGRSVDFITGEDPYLSAAQISNLFTVTAWSYERIWRHQSLAILTRGRLTVREELNRLKTFAGQVSPRVVVDLGCSTGLYGRTVGQHLSGTQVWFLDYSLPMLRQAARLNGPVPRFHYIRQYAEQPAFLPESVDLVICGGSLNEFADPDLVLRQVYRMLSPGGSVFFMGIQTAESPAGRAIQTALSWSGLSFLPKDQIIRHFTSNGLSVTRYDQSGPVFLLTAHR